MPFANTPLIHPKLFASLPKHFPSRCAIYAAVVATNSIGERILTPTDGALIGGQAPLAGMESIPCAISDFITRRLESNETRTETSTYVEALQNVLLGGYYPLITEAMRASIDGVVYNIRGVTLSIVHSHTELTVEVIT